jgi:hypothetical protein
MKIIERARELQKKNPILISELTPFIEIVLRERFPEDTEAFDVLKFEAMEMAEKGLRKDVIDKVTGYAMKIITTIQIRNRRDIDEDEAI